MKSFLRTYLPTILAGILLSWAFPRFHFHWMAWFALAPLFIRAIHATPRAAALHFFLCGHIFYTILLQWLIANIFWAGGWAILGQQGLCALLSLYWALLGYGWRWAYGRSPRYASALCFAGLWAGMEMLQARMFTGFGWGALGYTQGGNLFTAQWASIGGVTLISFCIVLVNAWLALAATHSGQRLMRLAAAVILVLVLNVGGYLLLNEADYETAPFHAGIVQPNFSQEMKWDPAYEVDMAQRTAQLSRALASRSSMDLLVWPEALIVRHYGSEPFLDILANTALDTRAYLFTGAVRHDYGTGKSYNAAALIGPDGADLGYYDKVRLAPFGEYIPFEEYLPFLGQIAFGGVSAGEEQIVFSVQERMLGPLICFEVLFAPMAEQLRGLGADMLAVTTNLAWFGGSNAIPQELEIARMRAIETRLPLVHSANTGISGVFDPYGRFQVVRHSVAARGDLVDWGEHAKPHHALMRRFVGVFPVAAPAPRFVPYGPMALPWILSAAGACLFVAAFIRGLLWEALVTRSKPKRKPKARTKTKAKATPEPDTGEKTAKPKKRGRKKKSTVTTGNPETEELFDANKDA